MTEETFPQFSVTGSTLETFESTKSICKFSVPPREADFIIGRSFSIGSLIFECTDLSKILEIFSSKFDDNAIGRLLQLNKQVHQERKDRGSPKCLHSLYAMLVSSFLNTDYAAIISQAKLSIILSHTVITSDEEVCIDNAFVSCKVNDWCAIFASLQNVALELKNEKKASMEIYMYCVKEIVKHPLWIQTLVEESIQLRVGPLKHLATRVTIENINWLMSKMKVTTSVNFLQQLFCSPSVTGKCVALFQLLEVHEVIWNSFNIGHLEALIPTLYTIIEWLFEKCCVLKDKVVAGFKWTKAKFQRTNDEDTRFSQVRKDLPETPDLVNVESVEDVGFPIHFVSMQKYLSDILDDKIYVQNAQSTDNNCLFEAIGKQVDQDPIAFRHATYDFIKSNRKDCISALERSGYVTDDANKNLDELVVALDDGLLISLDAIPVAEIIVDRKIIAYTDYDGALVGFDSGRVAEKTIYVRNPDAHWMDCEEQEAPTMVNYIGVPLEESAVVTPTPQPENAVPVTSITDQESAEIVEKLESTETGRSFLDWLKSATSNVYTFFKNNAIIGGVLAFIFSITSSLGITISQFKNYGDKRSFWQNLSSASKDFYYLSRGQDSVLKVFKDFGEILRDMLGIDECPEINAFKDALLEAAEKAEATNIICSTRPEKIINNPQQIIRMKETIDNVRSRYIELTRFNTTANLQVLQPIWTRITVAYAQLQANYAKFCNHCERRKEPVVVWFWGRSNIGKSQMIQNFLNEINLRQNTAHETFTVSKGPEFFNGYKQQKFILIDDFDSFSMVEGCLDALLIMNLKTSAPYNANMASIDQKDFSMEPDIVVISSNFPTAKLNCGVNDMEAFERRRDIVINVSWPAHDKCDSTDKNCDCWKAVKNAQEASHKMSFEHLTLTRNHSLFYANATIYKKMPQTVSKNKSIDAPNGTRVKNLGPTNLASIIDHTLQLMTENKRVHDMQVEALKEVRTNALKYTLVDPESDVIQESAQDWQVCPNVLLIGLPGSGKSTIQANVAKAPKTKRIISLEEFDAGSSTRWIYDDVDIVLFDDFTTIKNSVHVVAFWSEWKLRADTHDPRIATWILGMNEEVAIDSFATLEEYSVHTRADRARKFFFSFRPKPQSILYSFLFTPPVYTATDVNNATVPYDECVKIFDEKSGLNVMCNQLQATLKEWTPEIRGKYSQVRLAKIHHLDPIDAVSKIPLTSQEFVNLINTPGSMVSTMSLLTDCDFKSNRFTALQIGKRIYATFTSMIHYHSSGFSDMDTFILCGSNSGFFDKFNDGNFVLQFTDRAYCLSPRGNRVIAGIYEPVDAKKDLGELAHTIAQTINTFDFLRVSRSEIPPWLVLALGMVETFSKFAMTTACIPFIIKNNKEMFKAVTSKDQVLETTNFYHDQEIKRIAVTHEQLLAPRVIPPVITETWNNKGEDRNKGKRNRFNRVRARKGKLVSPQLADIRELNQCDLSKSIMDIFKDEDEVVAPELATDDSVYDIIAAVSKNFVQIVNAASKTPVVSGFMIAGKVGTTVGHIAWENKDVLRDLSRYLVKDINGKYYTMKFKSHDKDNDRLDFEVDSPVQFSDITKHLSKFEQSYFSNKLVVMASLTFNGIIPYLTLRFFRVKSYDTVDLDKYYKSMSWSFTGGLSGFVSDMPPQTKKGDCGSVVFLCDPTRNQKIIGMHIASSSTMGYFRAMTLSMYTAVANGEACMDFIGPLDEFEKPRYPTKEGIQVLARCTQAPFQPTKTRLYRSPFAYGNCLHEPSVLCRRDPRAPDIDDMVYKESMKWLSAPVKFVAKEKEIINNRFSLLGDYLGQKLQVYGIETSKLTKTAALNSVRGFTHSKPIPVATSAGYPYNMLVTSGKTNLVHVNPTDGSRKFTNERVLFDSLHLSIDHIIRQARNGLCAEVAFQVFPKDELLKKEKLKTKTRTIAAAPFPLVVALRQYFHTIYAALAELFDVLPIKVGIAPNSLDWCYLTQRLLGVSPEGFSIDQTDFDFNVPRELSEGVVFCLNAISQWTDPGMTVEDQYVRTNLHKNVSEFKIIVNGLVYQTTKGVPSGHPGTATENSIISLFCMFDAFCELAPNYVSATVESFFESVGAAIYGDDALCTVIPSIQTWFNLQTVSEYLTNKYGMVITTADKSSINYLVKPLLDLQFISRSFTPFGKYYVGPLEMNRLIKPLNFCHGSKAHHYFEEPNAITDDISIALDAAKSALDEMFFHGEEKYESLRKHLFKIAKQIGATEAYFAPYSERYQEFFNLSDKGPTGLYVSTFPIERSVSSKLCQEKGWFSYNSRRCILFGSDYHWDSKSTGRTQQMPLFVSNILRRVNTTLSTEFNQVLVNEYSPPAGRIDYHKDNETGLDKEMGVASLTVAGDGQMQWCNASQVIVGTFDCVPGTLYHMCGKFVTDYRHRRINHTKYTITMTFRRIDSS